MTHTADSNSFDSGVKCKAEDAVEESEVPASLGSINLNRYEFRGRAKHILFSDSLQLFPITYINTSMEKDERDLFRVLSNQPIKRIKEIHHGPNII